MVMSTAPAPHCWPDCSCPPTFPTVDRRITNQSPTSRRRWIGPFHVFFFLSADFIPSHFGYLGSSIKQHHHHHLKSKQTYYQENKSWLPPKTTTQVRYFPHHDSLPFRLGAVASPIPPGTCQPHNQPGIATWTTAATTASAALAARLRTRPSSLPRHPSPKRIPVPPP